MRIAWKSVPVFVKGIVLMIGSLFTGILTKILLAATLLCGSVACVSVYLYLGTRDELTSLQSTYRQLKQDYTDLDKSRERVVEVSKQTDVILVDKEAKINTLEDQKDSLLERLDKIAKERKCNPPSPKSTTEPHHEVINIANGWDTDIQQLLNEAYDQNKRDANPTP